MLRLGLGSTEVVAQMGVPFRDPGFRAIDEFEGDLTSKVDVTGDTIDITAEGGLT